MPIMKSDIEALWERILMSLEVGYCRQGFVPVEPLVGAAEPVAVYYRASAAGVEDYLVDVGGQLREDRIGGLPVLRDTQQGLDLKSGDGPGDIAGVDVSHVQGAIAHLFEGLGASESQFREGRSR